MKQTAVKWLEKEIFRYMQGSNIIDLFEQAKEMEKQQKEYFFNCGRNYQLTGEGTFKEIYNETFNK
jgi:hypothetical protein